MSDLEPPAIDRHEGDILEWRFVMTSSVTPTGEHVLRFQTPETASTTDLVGSLFRAALSYAIEADETSDDV